MKDHSAEQQKAWTPKLPGFEDSEMPTEIHVVVRCPQIYGRPISLLKCSGCSYYRGREEETILCAFTREDAHIEIDSRNELNELAGNEWLFFTKSVLQTSYPSEFGQDLRREHGANKPPRLMKHIIEFFTRTGETVLDPFAGVGGTLIGASICQRRATGIEINKKWADVYHEVCVREGIQEQEMILGDCLEVLEDMIRKGRKFDFVATDPPYSIALEKTLAGDKYAEQFASRRTNFDTFSDDPRDFRNLADFDEYYDAIQEFATRTYQVLRPNRYMAVIIRDSYQDGEYIMASYEIAERIKKAGFTMKGVKIWYQSGAPVRPYGYPYAYVPNIVHQNILIFRKEN